MTDDSELGDIGFSELARAVLARSPAGTKDALREVLREHLAAVLAQLARSHVPAMCRHVLLGPVVEAGAGVMLCI